jgi:hypothetical protein
VRSDGYRRGSSVIARVTRLVTMSFPLKKIENKKRKIKKENNTNT